MVRYIGGLLFVFCFFAKSQETFNEDQIKYVNILQKCLASKNVAGTKKAPSWIIRFGGDSGIIIKRPFDPGETTDLEMAIKNEKSEITAFARIILNKKGDIFYFFPYIFPSPARELKAPVEWDIPLDQKGGKYILIGCAVDLNGVAFVARDQIVVTGVCDDDEKDEPKEEPTPVKKKHRRHKKHS